MALGSNNPFPSVLLVENTSSPEQPSSPAAGKQRIFVRSSDHHLCRVNSSGTVTDIEAAAAAGTLDGLSDVVITSVADGDVLTYDTAYGEWVNAQPAGGGGGSGVVVQVVNYQTGAVSSASTQIPMDDTIPQNTEGTEYMTLSITPTSATHKLRIDVLAFAGSAGTDWNVLALFQDSTANALAVGYNYGVASTAMFPMPLTHYMTAGTTSATTFKVRMGTNSGGTLTFNGRGGARDFGGVIASSITISEIVP